MEFGRFDAVHDWHVHVHEHYVKFGVQQCIERFLTIVDESCAMANTLQNFRNHHLVRRIVLGNEN